MANKVTEHGEAVALFEYVQRLEKRYPELRLFHAVPNGSHMSWGKDKNGRRISRAAIAMKAEGMRNGVPDYCLPAPKGPYHGFYLELKANNYMPSDEQVFFLLYTRALGYCSVCRWGFDAARDALDKYLAGEVIGASDTFLGCPKSKEQKLSESLARVAVVMELM
jgi:hypothetical protein